MTWGRVNNDRIFIFGWKETNLHCIILKLMLIKIHTLVLTATLSQTQTDVIRSLSNTCPCKQTERERERETEKVKFYNLFINLNNPPSLSLSLSPAHLCNFIQTHPWPGLCPQCCRSSDISLLSAENLFSLILNTSIYSYGKPGSQHSVLWVFNNSKIKVIQLLVNTKEHPVMFLLLSGLLYVCVYIYILCVCVCVYTVYRYIYIYIYTHTHIINNDWSRDRGFLTDHTFV